jgi:hypothetical protein
MNNKNNNLSLDELEGKLGPVEYNSGLVIRCHLAHSKPLACLSNEELATLIRQKIGLRYLVPLAKDRLQSKFEDSSELYEGELFDAVNGINI